MSTYLGGSLGDYIYALATDSAGNNYVTGTTYSTDFPVRNAYNGTYGGVGDAFIAKFNTSGYLLFSTYFGGSANDFSSGIAVDQAQKIYIAGGTYSSNFPLKNAYQPASHVVGTENAFVAKFSSEESLVFSTYLGGSSTNWADGIAVDTSGNCYVVGGTWSSNFPLKNAWNATYGGGSEGFLTKYDPLGTLVYSTIIDESNQDELTSVAVDVHQNIFATGYTTSPNFPQIDSMQTLKGSPIAVYVKFNSTGSLVFSTYYGGSSSEISSSIAVDNNDDSVITGFTYSSNFPLKNAFENTLNGSQDAFVTKFASNNTGIFSTYLGGNESDLGKAVAMDSAGNIYIVGSTKSSDFFVTTDAYQKIRPSSLNNYVFLTKFSPTGSVLYSTYFGRTSAETAEGIAVDANNNAFVGITTGASDMPITKNAYYPSYFNSYDGFIAGFYSDLGPITSTPSLAISSSLTSQTTQTSQASSSSQTTTPSTSNSISLQNLLNNPEFLGLGVVAVLAVLLNVILLIRRRK